MDSLIVLREYDPKILGRLLADKTTGKTSSGLRTVIRIWGMPISETSRFSWTISIEQISCSLEYSNPRKSRKNGRRKRQKFYACLDLQSDEQPD